MLEQVLAEVVPVGQVRLQLEVVGVRVATHKNYSHRH
jgi:hypothetical protein